MTWECLQLHMEGVEGILSGSKPLSCEQEGSLVCTQNSQIWGERKNKLMSRVHEGNEMLKQQATGKQNMGSLGRALWQL